jgi:hypothetical protein
MVSAIGYTRISSVGQRTIDGSLSHQKKVIEEMCRDRADSEGFRTLVPIVFVQRFRSFRTPRRWLTPALL